MTRAPFCIILVSVYRAQEPDFGVTSSYETNQIRSIIVTVIAAVAERKHRSNNPSYKRGNFSHSWAWMGRIAAA
uniref:Uncharacterized protein n=1 Tax=Anopheles triannulatus TaxID=58253 RepID=A0A2M4AXE4_9DIPT